MRKKDVFAILAIFIFSPLLLTFVLTPRLKGDVFVIRDKPAPGSAPPPPILNSRNISAEGVVTQVIDATSEERWTYFSFEKGVVESQGGEEIEAGKWDLVFRKKKIVSNSGPVNRSGVVGIVNLGENRKFGDLKTAPASGYVLTEERKGDLVNNAIKGWYLYDFWKHRMNPVGELYVVRTSKGRFVKMEIENYYCGKQDASGCYTIKFAWLD